MTRRVVAAMAATVLLLLGAACADNGVRYSSCAEAPGPLEEGDPGYRSALDRDGDGIACDTP